LSTAEARYLKINYDEVLQKLKEYAKSKAKTHQGVKAIILTGSLAKGDYTGCSDADILVLSEALPYRVLERYSLFAATDLPLDVEPRAYTIVEFLRMVRGGDHFALEALRVGIPLFGDTYFKELRESAYEGSRRELRRGRSEDRRREERFERRYS
jgi:predicted nucleotidyltransferase